jgi:hypothetical protein
MNTTTKTVCPHCGQNDFSISESTVWKAFVDENGEVQANINTNEIDNIVCRKCQAEFSPLFFGPTEINFN